LSVMEIFEHRRPAGVGRYEWQPYAEDANFTHHWWHQAGELGSRYSLWSASRRGLEVARIKLDQEVSYDHYERVPDLGPRVLEIDLFEVSSAVRGQRIGRSVIHLVAEFFPERRLVAFSEQADGFWSGLGWTRYDHPDGFPAYRPLFVAPEG
jgi:hypothetical protein